MSISNCYHCGELCEKDLILIKEKAFCCIGCKTVYEIFTANGLDNYYKYQAAAGKSPEEIAGKYDFLDTPDIVSQLLSFDEVNIQVVELQIPHIHCSSCIWILENLNKLDAGITNTEVDFPQKKVRITYRTGNTSLKKVVQLLSKIGYAPYLQLESYNKKEPKVDRNLIYKIGVSGFAFGNIMFLSFPEYFELEEFWLEQYKIVFRWLMFAFSLPVVLYGAQDYFVSAFKGLRAKLINIDIPIALGILTLFIRSTIDISLGIGTGFFDSLSGLVFFLLLGRFFQQKTYNFLSFERDYKSYFPIAVTKLSPNGIEESIQVYRIKGGDRLWIRNQELIPVDGVLMRGSAQIDYSFVTGESRVVNKVVGDTLFAGGKQLGGAFEMQALKSIAQSYLTQLWSNAAFSKNKASDFQTLTDQIGKRFTWAVLSIAVAAALFWWYYEPSQALHVFTAVLIIACPCAIALAAPFTLGNILRIFGRHKFYVKDVNTLERLAQIDMAIFDKTGTLTIASDTTISYEGTRFSETETALLKNTLRASNHPLSHQLYGILKSNNITPLDAFREEIGSGIEGKLETHKVKIGSAKYVGVENTNISHNTTVYVSADETYKGRFVFKNSYRPSLVPVFQELCKDIKLSVLSGDTNGEQQRLRQLVPKQTKLYFNQKPEDKLRFVKAHQNKKQHVLMVGDGLNDAGALAQSDVGIAIAENVNVFSPACDGILDASQFEKIPAFLRISKAAMRIIKWSFLLSLCYNIIGLGFAVTGNLKPVVAAILMPLSSISIVLFTTITTNILGKQLARKS